MDCSKETCIGKLIYDLHKLFLWLSNISTKSRKIELYAI